MYKLRNATIDDARLLYDWANDEDVRAMAIVKKTIVWDEHIRWLTNKLQSDQSHIFILTGDQNEHIGVVRFDKDGEEFVISYSIDRLHRNKGMGILILQLGIKKILETDSLCKFAASVQTDNIASNKIFEKLGFRMESTEITGGTKFNYYYKDGNK